MSERESSSEYQKSSFHDVTHEQSGTEVTELQQFINKQRSIATIQ
jgi:hypothetical protein